MKTTFNRKLFRRTVMIAIMTGLHAQAEPAPDGTKADGEMAAWLETSLLLSREKSDWNTVRATLQDRIALLESELAGLKQKTDAADAEGAKTAVEIDQLEEEKERLVKTTEGLVQDVIGLETGLRSFLTKAPDPVRERVRPLSQRLPAEPARATSSTSERFQNVIGIMNELGKFGREVTLASEIRDLEDGTRVEVTAMYLGFGQAYYVNAEKGIAGVGRPDDKEGWVWSMDPGIAPDVQQAIGIYRNELPAAYVRLPVRIQNTLGGEVQP